MTSKFTGAGFVQLSTALPCFARCTRESEFNTLDTPSSTFLLREGEILYIVKIKDVYGMDRDRKVEVTFISENGMVRTVKWWVSYSYGSLGCIEKVEA